MEKEQWQAHKLQLPARFYIGISCESVINQLLLLFNSTWTMISLFYLPRCSPGSSSSWVWRIAFTRVCDQGLLQCIAHHRSPGIWLLFFWFLFCVSRRSYISKELGSTSAGGASTSGFFPAASQPDLPDDHQTTIGRARIISLPTLGTNTATTARGGLAIHELQGGNIDNQSVRHYAEYEQKLKTELELGDDENSNNMAAFAAAASSSRLSYGQLPTAKLGAELAADRTIGIISSATEQLQEDVVWNSPHQQTYSGSQYPGTSYFTQMI